MATTKKRTGGTKSTSARSSAGKSPEGDSPSGEAPRAPSAKKTPAKRTPAKKKAAKKTAAKKPKAAPPKEPVDPRAPVVLSAKSLEATVAEVEVVLARLEAPTEPAPSDLVDALVHFVFSAGLPCGIGQEVLRRIDEEFVDRNEFRITEAYEVEILFADLGIPGLFDRCLTVQQAVNQIYNDQNKVSLDHLREASISERKSFFQRVPAISADAASFLGVLLAWEEIAFSPRSTQRVRLRIGLDPKHAGQAAAIDRLRAALAPFGHIPLQVGAEKKGGKPVLEPVLSPACILLRLRPGA